VVSRRDLNRLLNGAARAGELAAAAQKLLGSSPESRYRQTHGGHDGWGRPPLRSTAPDPREVSIELGTLTRIAYLAAKNPDGRVEEFIHDFETPYPVLAFTSAGLVIVRDRSKYTVTSHGIEG
jgi:hypothetical protein